MWENRESVKVVMGFK